MKTFTTDAYGDVAVPAAARRTEFLPDVALAEFPDYYEVTAGLRGISPDDVTVSFRDQVLTLASDSPTNPTPGLFRYSIGLPADASAEDISCTFGDDEIVVTIARECL
ncbi:MAG: Hsp20/alpha crystallin family protein [Rhodospirillaceae bacterium]|nr:Hsp20/alpha crystallin family protein [Rhodospirillaceae bacterium]